jgi:hypothetical protein
MEIRAHSWRLAVRVPSTTWSKPNRHAKVPTVPTYTQPQAASRRKPAGGGGGPRSFGPKDAAGGGVSSQSTAGLSPSQYRISVLFSSSLLIHSWQRGATPGLHANQRRRHVLVENVTWCIFISGQGFTMTEQQ